MSESILVRNGLIVDGTGRPAIAGDVLVSDGRVREVGGAISARGASVIEAGGSVVAPGFIDVHTHYDAQLQWDSVASPSAMHGVTTVIGGNCGFTLAPLGAANVEYLLGMMSRVEGMPESALAEGLSWDWDGYGEWLDRLDGKVGVNAAFMVGHSTVRRYVMGTAASERPCTADELQAMRRVVRESIGSGAIGFSTSFQAAHNDAAGLPVPSRVATLDEFIGLADALRGTDAVGIGLVPQSLTRFTDRDAELMVAMSRLGGVPVNWNLFKPTSADGERGATQLSLSDRAKAGGAEVLALVLTHSVPPVVTFINGFILDAIPGWSSFLRLPLDERSAALKDETVAGELERSAAAVSGRVEYGVVGQMAAWENVRIVSVVRERNRQFEGRTVGEAAKQLGLRPFDALCRIVISDDLGTRLQPPTGDDDDESWRLRAEAWVDDRTLIGGSDAGAHLDMICPAIYTTSLLGEGVRTRQLISIEEAVRQLTDIPAMAFGLRQRGRVEPGYHADLVIFDPGEIGFGPIHPREDLPGGQARLYSEARGISHVFVNGEELIRGGEVTGSAPGQVIRSGRDTERFGAKSR